jgi:LSD1 subclass zinc finger protein
VSEARCTEELLSNPFPCQCWILVEVGGEGGIRTRVGVFSPQTAFEAAPLRPLRYLSGVVSVKAADCQTVQAWRRRA